MMELGWELSQSIQSLALGICHLQDVMNSQVYTPKNEEQAARFRGT